MVMIPAMHRPLCIICSPVWRWHIPPFTWQTLEAVPAPLEALPRNQHRHRSRLYVLLIGTVLSSFFGSMYNSNVLGLMGTASQLNMIANELGANNLSETVGETQKATHGKEASWETILTLDPEYMFILDRSTATGGVQALDAKLFDLEGALLN